MKGLDLLPVWAGAGLLLCGLGLGWRGFQLPEAVPNAVSHVTPFQAKSRTASSELQSEWGVPPHQSAGPDWVFEVFTPPLVFFNEAAGTFSLQSPLSDAESDAWDVVFLGVERPLYRLQYGGHSGDGERVFVEIQDVENDRWLRGRVGQRFADAAFRLVAFEAEQVRITSDPGATPYVESAIRMTVYDERIRETVTLTAAPRLQEAPLALLSGEGGTEIRVDVGAEWNIGPVRYRLDALNVEAPSATVTRLARPSLPAQTRELMPSARLALPGGAPEAIR